VEDEVLYRLPVMESHDSVTPLTRVPSVTNGG
jgi:hypothetical protein